MVPRSSSRDGGHDAERGAALVEFAVILPVLMMLVLGMFTGGLAYNRKISLTNAAREASRYGASLPLEAYPTPDAWLRGVADVAQQNASGDLAPTAPGHRICVAYVLPDGAGARMLVRTGAAEVVTDVTATGASACLSASDGRPVSEGRVHVAVARIVQLEALVFRHDLGLTASSVTRFEAAS